MYHNSADSSRWPASHFSTAFRETPNSSAKPAYISQILVRRVSMALPKGIVWLVVSELIDSSIEITPLAFYLEIGLIRMQLFPGLAFALGFQRLSKYRSEALFPLAHGLMGKLKAACEKHFGQVPEAQLVAQSPENHEKYDLGRIVHIIKWAASSFIIRAIADRTGESRIATFRLLSMCFRLRIVTIRTRH